MNGKKARLLRRMKVNQPSSNVRQVSAAIYRLRKSGLFVFDIDAWIEFFNKNPDQATPGFVNFIISERRSQPVCAVYTFD